VKQFTKWCGETDPVNAFNNRLDKHWFNQDVLFNFNADFNVTGSLPICKRTWCYSRCGQRGLPAPVRTHWIGLDYFFYIFYCTAVLFLPLGWIKMNIYYKDGQLHNFSMSSRWQLKTIRLRLSFREVQKCLVKFVLIKRKYHTSCILRL